MSSRVCNGLRAFGRSILASRKASAVLLAFAVTATVIASPPARPDPSSKPTPAAKTHRWFQIGKASWYGRGFQGRRTATGERFDMNSLTCAHRTLPLGSWLRITNLRNRKSTFVRVNDRGPYTTNANTIVDLSYAAAEKLGLLGNGKVKVEQVRPDDPELTHALLADLATTDLPLSTSR